MALNSVLTGANCSKINFINSTQLLTNSLIEAADSFPFHCLYEAIHHSPVDWFINGLSLQTNFERVERMTDKSDPNSTGSAR